MTTKKNARETEKINLGLFLTAVCGETDLLCAFLRLVLLSLGKCPEKKWYTAISRKVVGKSAGDSPERYCGWF